MNRGAGMPTLSYRVNACTERIEPEVKSAAPRSEWLPSKKTANGVKQDVVRLLQKLHSRRMREEETSSPFDTSDFDFDSSMHSPYIKSRSRRHSYISSNCSTPGRSYPNSTFHDGHWSTSSGKTDRFDMRHGNEHHSIPKDDRFSANRTKQWTEIKDVRPPAGSSAHTYQAHPHRKNNTSKNEHCDVLKTQFTRSRTNISPRREKPETPVSAQIPTEIGQYAGKRTHECHREDGSETGDNLTRPKTKASSFTALENPSAQIMNHSARKRIESDNVVHSGETAQIMRRSARKRIEPIDVLHGDETARNELSSMEMFDALNRPFVPIPHVNQPPPASSVYRKVSMSPWVREVYKCVEERLPYHQECDTDPALARQ